MIVKAVSWLFRIARFPLDVLRSYPWQTICVALAMASVWLWNGRQSAVAGRALDRVSYVAAQAQAAALAQSERIKHEQEYRDEAKRSQAEHDASEAALRAIADRAIAAGRLRLQRLASAASNPGTATTGRGAAVPAKVPTEAELDAGRSLPTGYVLMPEADVTICTLDYGYAVDAAKWAERAFGKKEK